MRILLLAALLACSAVASGASAQQPAEQGSAARQADGRSRQPAPVLTPVPEAEVQAWTTGSTWCLNPENDGCRALFYWQRSRSGQLVELALVGLGESEADGMLSVAAPFRMQGARQCYNLRVSDLAFERVGGPGAVNEQAAEQMEREWREEVERQAGREECVAFFRDQNGLIRQRRFYNGVAQPEDPDEVFRVRLGRPDAESTDL